VERRDINYLRSIIESYDGMAIVKTLDPHTAYIEVRIAPGCEDYILELMDSLSREEGLRIEKADASKEQIPDQDLLHKDHGLSDE
jgi:hypothetical protein